MYNNAKLCKYLFILKLAKPVALYAWLFKICQVIFVSVYIRENCTAMNNLNITT